MKLPVPMPMSYLHFLVFLCQFTTQFLKLILHRDRLVKFRLPLLLVLLQLIGSLLAFGVIPVQLLHIGQ